MTTISHSTGQYAGGVAQIQELRYNLFQAVSWLNNGMRSLLKPYGITPKQLSILTNLATRGEKAASIQEVRDGLADKMSDASRLIDRLVKKGYLEKFPSEADRRSNLVKISASGKRILREIQTQREALDRLISDRLSREEISQLNRLLSELK